MGLEAAETLIKNIALVVAFYDEESKKQFSNATLSQVTNMSTHQLDEAPLIVRLLLD